ncbi:hypothetical protein HRW23_30130 [Streptomyces lunaelactis]|uniref:hypothetical protein n=1 Tax=Streptomyces lunaelactis TaxID=1535768 RepID=UPI001584C2E2|nr:hypothetical protein [Streptomyces lunaelactis]NUK01350.1 hypothetical protein [Streptomyces lunaelactis]NUK08748.1 hypothetical protein [Streptomyces lunaelactis]NUK15339.1 hypothetical protein [Streptomyces lunaelactis]NUK22504.1 hypothetical protein [Streptomyces lunaelactis]NUK32642.1 hypothetical protein [Streptomyces lunaelactis]
MSDIDNAAFFGAVLKAIACTRNHSTDESEYSAGVLAPATKIRQFEQTAAGRLLTIAEADQVLALLRTTFSTKETPDEEREYYLQYIEKVSGLTRASLGVSA